MKRILLQFGRFEENGTLPNMIRGNDAGNRDTSDAPLWFAVVCADLTLHDPDFPKTPCGARTIGQVARAIAEGYIAGTPNGIKMDPESGLVYSPHPFHLDGHQFSRRNPETGISH